MLCCKKCGNWKPYHEYASWSAGIDKDGYLCWRRSYICKFCKNSRSNFLSKKSRLEKREKIDSKDRLIGLLKCSKCLELKPYFEFPQFWYFQKEKISRLSGLIKAFECKRCKNERLVSWGSKRREIINEQNKQYYYRNHQKILKRGRIRRLKNKTFKCTEDILILDSNKKLIGRTCSKCGIYKTKNNFWRKRNHRGQPYAYGYEPKCKNCESETQRQYKLRNREKYLKWRRPYAKKKRREWVKNNPEKVRVSARIQGRKQRAKLGNAYIKRLIRKNFNLEYREINSEMIELKRSQIKLLRLCRQARKEIDHGFNRERD